MATIVAITSCPTGIAHTFMAAEGLEQAAVKLGHTIKVETQGSVGAQNQLTANDVAAADIVLIAADTSVDLSRRSMRIARHSRVNSSMMLSMRYFLPSWVRSSTKS